MSKHIIAATDPTSQSVPTPVRYFLGYRDDGTAFEPVWTLDPWRASWIDAAEAELEVALLAALCPDARIQSTSLGTVRSANASNDPF
jgi:hypothetical protein